MLSAELSTILQRLVFAVSGLATFSALVAEAPES